LAALVVVAIYAQSKAQTTLDKILEELAAIRNEMLQIESRDEFRRGLSEK